MRNDGVRTLAMDADLRILAVTELYPGHDDADESVFTLHRFSGYFAMASLQIGHLMREDDED